MKTITRSRIYLPMATIILTAALAIPAAAQTQVPFKGTFQGNDTVAPPTITTNGTGIGTLVGQLSLTDVVTLTSASGGTGTGLWVAANGDTIDSTFVASAIPGDVLFTITEIHTITGGTGRFTGAQGSFTVLRKHVVAPSSDGTHFTWGSFQGSITPPSAAH
jgi:hypothetical protein